MTKTVRRLSGLEIDEVSLVDRPANQHGLVAITKRDEGPMLFDADGNPVDEASLQPGDVVYDENDTELVALSAEDVQRLEDEANDPNSQFQQQYAANELFDDEPSPLAQLAGVGKSAGPAAVTGGASSLFQTGRRVANQALGAARAGRGSSNVSAVGRGGKTFAHIGRNAERYGIGAAAGTTGAAMGNAHGRKVGASKSLGAQVLEELSKAASDTDRDQVIAKALGQIDEADQRAEQAWTIAKALQDQQELGQYVELAKSYELPGDPTDLGEILQAVAKALSPEQLNTVDRIFSFAGDAFAAQTQEVGSGGYQPSLLMGQVADYASSVVGKSDLTPEQATTALFEANPEAYDAYLSEQSAR